MDYRAADLMLQNAKPKALAYELALGGGLSARIAADGVTKTLYWRGKKDRRVIRVRLGNYPDMTIRQAADAALKVHSSVRNGVDPNLKARRVAAGASAPVTVREAAERFMAEHLDVKVGARWRDEAKRILQVDILPSIGTYRLSDISRTDLTSVVDKKAAALKKQSRSGVAANRMVALLGRFSGFCADKGWLPTNPAVRLPKPVVEVKRKRVLSSVEIGEAWTALQDIVCGEDECRSRTANPGAVDAHRLPRVRDHGLAPSGYRPQGRLALDCCANSRVAARPARRPDGASDPCGRVRSANRRGAGRAALPNAPGGRPIPSLDISKAARRLVADWDTRAIRRTICADRS